MKRVAFALGILIILCGASSFACESCVDKGSLDPNGGGPYNSAICWTSSGGQWSWCVGGNTTCTGGTDGSCGGSDVCVDPGSSCILNPASFNGAEGPVKKCAVDVSGACSIRGARPSILR